MEPGSSKRNKNLYNVTNYLIWNTMTGLKKASMKRAENVISDTFQEQKDLKCLSSTEIWDFHTCF